MKPYFISVLILFITPFANKIFSQDQEQLQDENRKGQFYIYWGWNGSNYGDSDIEFTGDDYDFTLRNASASDRQSDISFDKFLNPANATIPQYNFRIGYFIKNKYSVSFGIDHMKYVLDQGQTVRIDGEINNSNTVFDGIYNNDEIEIQKELLEFEHTDGLNYINFDIRRFDKLLDVGNFLDINVTEGVGVGFLLPKTNATLLDNERYDEFHLAGYGINGVLGLNFLFFDKFFLQTEIKGGFIDLPDVRTTSSRSDRANQSFFFFQYNATFGINFKFKKRKEI